MLRSTTPCRRGKTLDETPRFVLERVPGLVGESPLTNALVTVPQDLLARYTRLVSARKTCTILDRVLGDSHDLRRVRLTDRQLVWVALD